MNERVSFCVKNRQGMVSLKRILKFKSDGEVFIEYEKRDSYFHTSFHQPNAHNNTGQWHVKMDDDKILIRAVQDFEDFNSDNLFGSMVMLESELIKPAAEFDKSVITLEVPAENLIHTLILRCDKGNNPLHGSKNLEPIADRFDTKQGDYLRGFDIFHSFENMPIVDYYLAYRTDTMSNYKDIGYVISDIKCKCINSLPAVRNDYITAHVSLQFNSFPTDMEITITQKDFIEYKEINQPNDRDNTKLDMFYTLKP